MGMSGFGYNCGMDTATQNRAVFLDRDGVINIEKEYLHRIDEFDFIDGVFEACQKWQNDGYILFIVTNQSGIGRGYYTEKDFDKLTSWMLEQFAAHHISITHVYHCPHTPNAGCSCRKPLPGMFEEAKKTYTLDMSSSWMIGDKESDIEAARAAGITQTILVQSGHKIDAQNSKATYVLGSIKEAKDII